MAWIVISESDLLTRISGAELSALRAAALADNQPDPIPDTIDQVVKEVRYFVAGNPANTLNPAGNTIPDVLLNAALDAIVINVMKRPGSTIFDDAAGTRKAAGEAAFRLFRTAQPHGNRFEGASTPGETASTTGSATIHPPRRHEDFSGL
jgi:hypothetical protein